MLSLTFFIHLTNEIGINPVFGGFLQQAVPKYAKYKEMYFANKES